jgi:hypothetical protein
MKHAKEEAAAAVEALAHTRQSNQQAIIDRLRDDLAAEKRKYVSVFSYSGR